MQKLLGLLVLGLAFSLAVGSIGCTGGDKDKDKKKDAGKKDTETTDKKADDKKADDKKADDKKADDKKADDKKAGDGKDEGKVTLNKIGDIDVTIDKDGKGHKTFDVEVVREKYDDVIKIRVTAPKEFKGKATIKGDNIAKKEVKTSVDLTLEGAEKGTYDFTVEAVAASSDKIKSGTTLKVNVK